MIVGLLLAVFLCINWYNIGSRERYARELGQLGTISVRIVKYATNSSGVPPSAIDEFVPTGVISKKELNLLKKHETRYFPPNVDSPQDFVVVTLSISPVSKMEVRKSCEKRLVDTSSGR